MVHREPSMPSNRSVATSTFGLPPHGVALDRYDALGGDAIRPLLPAETVGSPRLVGHEGLEPSANGLRVRCSTN